MSSGFETLNADGSLRVSVTDRITRFHARYTGSLGAGASANISVPGMSNDGTWGVSSMDTYIAAAINNGYVRLTNWNTFGATGYDLQVFRF